MTQKTARGKRTHGKKTKSQKMAQQRRRAFNRSNARNLKNMRRWKEELEEACREQRKKLAEANSSDGNESEVPAQSLNPEPPKDNAEQRQCAAESRRSFHTHCTHCYCHGCTGCSACGFRASSFSFSGTCSMPGFRQRPLSNYYGFSTACSFACTTSTPGTCMSMTGATMPLRPSFIFPCHGCNGFPPILINRPGSAQQRSSPISMPEERLTGRYDNPKAYADMTLDELQLECCNLKLEKLTMQWDENTRTMLRYDKDVVADLRHRIKVVEKDIRIIRKFLKHLGEYVVPETVTCKQVIVSLRTWSEIN